MVYIANAIRSQKPSLGRVAVSALYDDRYRKGSDVQRNAHSLHPLSEGVAKTAFHFVTEQRPDLHCIMQGEFCQKLPPWVYGGVQLEGASLLYIRWEIVSSGRGDFAACGRRVTFPAMGKSPKDRRGTPQRRTSFANDGFPPVPRYGGRVPVKNCKISGAQNLSGWSKFPPGHWALAFPKL